MLKYSFCESSHAGSFTPWHIRKLTKIGRKLGGGADTPALCGRKVAWDLSWVPHNNLKSSCKKCVEIYKRILTESVEVK